MKKIISYILIALSCVLNVGCNKAQHTKNQHVEDKILEESAFNKVLTKELLKFMECYKDRQEIGNIMRPYWIEFRNEDSVYYVIIVLDDFYDKEYMFGYTYMKGNLVAYYRSDNVNETSINEFVFTNKLIKLTDTIPHYLSYQDLGDNIPNIDSPFREYKIISKDSLQLVAKRGVCSP